jgi:hypothetical protein
VTAPRSDVQRLAVGVVLAVGSGDRDGLRLLLDAMNGAELRGVVQALGELAAHAIAGRAGSPEAARWAMETFARELAIE